MPTTPSAIKRLRQSTKRRLHNRIAKKIIRTYMKRTLVAAAAKDFDKAEADFRTATAKLDKAGARRILHPNTAARRKSKLAREYKSALSKARAQSQTQPQADD
jgi:small subunit ribosomal protein S20